jgi:hypothetical protein
VPVERLEDVLWTAQVVDCVAGGAFHNLKYVRYCSMTRDTLKAIYLVERGNIEKLKGQDVKM